MNDSFDLDDEMNRGYRSLSYQIKQLWLHFFDVGKRALSLEDACHAGRDPEYHAAVHIRVWVLYRRVWEN